jgi:DNA-binding NarL/FixJ family response regulator
MRRGIHDPKAAFMERLVRVIVLRATKPSGARAPLLPAGAAVTVLADTGLDAVGLKALTSATPEVVVADLRGLVPAEVAPAIKRIRDASPRTRVVAIGDPGSDAAAQQAIAAGAAAYQSTDINPATVLRAVTAASSGEMHLTRTGRRAMKSLLGGVPVPPKDKA